MNLDELTKTMIEEVNEHVATRCGDFLFDAAFIVEQIRRGEDFSFIWLVREGGTFLITSQSDWNNSQAKAEQKSKFLINYSEEGNNFKITRL